MDATSSVTDKPNRRFLTHLLASRVERALYERVEAAAAAEGRSMSGYVRKVLLDRLPAQERA